MLRFKPQEFVLQTGGTLVLNEDGSIDYLDEDGEFENSWDADDPGWETQAKLFGVPVDLVDGEAEAAGEDTLPAEGEVTL